MSAVSYGERIRRVPSAGLPATALPFFYATVFAAIAAAAVTSAAPAHDVRWTVFATVLVGGALAQLFAARTAGNQVFHTGLAFSVAAALLLPPELVVVVCVAQQLPDWLRQRYAWYIQSFNIANFVLSGLAAWAVRASFARYGAHVTASATTVGVLVAVAAGVTFVLVDHAVLARMLRLARGHDLSASGLFTFDGLIQDGVLAAVGIGIAFMLLHSWALVVVIVLPLVLIQRVLALPTLRERAAYQHRCEDPPADVVRRRCGRDGRGGDRREDHGVEEGTRGRGKARRRHPPDALAVRERAHAATSRTFVKRPIRLAATARSNASTHRSQKSVPRPRRISSNASSKLISSR